MTRDTPKKLSAAKPWFPDQELDRIGSEVKDVLRGGRLILGPRAAELERLFAERVGVAHAVALSSCTAALEIVYRHLRVEGREVVVPTNTFVATAAAVLHAGGRPVFADMCADDYSIDVDDALARVTSHTAAVVVVHIAGFVASGIERLRRECKERGVALIEDCAHAHGARLGDREAGGLADAGCFSFYPTKILTSAVGGLLTTDDPDLAALARSLRHHGQGASLESIDNLGNDWVMDEVRAVIGLSQLRCLDEIVERRRAVAARYDALLAGDARVTLPRLIAGSSPVFYKYPVLLPERADRDAVRKQLLDKHGIEAGALYSPPCHLMPVFRRLLGTGPGTLPRAEALLARQITLPMHAALEPDDADRVVEALDAVFRTMA